MQKTITAHIQYLISCPACRNCWIASRQEVIDLDIVSCAGCGGSNLYISKTWEV